MPGTGFNGFNNVTFGQSNQFSSNFGHGHFPNNNGNVQSFQLPPALAWQAIQYDVQNNLPSSVQYTSPIQGGIAGVSQQNLVDASQSWQQQVTVQQLIQSGGTQFAFNEEQLLDYNQNGVIGDDPTERAGVALLLDGVSNGGQITGAIQNVPAAIQTTVELMKNAQQSPQFVALAQAIGQKLAPFVQQTTTNNTGLTNGTTGLTSTGTTGLTSTELGTTNTGF